MDSLLWIGVEVAYLEERESAGVAQAVNEVSSAVDRRGVRVGGGGRGQGRGELRLRLAEERPRGVITGSWGGVIGSAEVVRGGGVRRESEGPEGVSSNSALLSPDE